MATQLDLSLLRAAFDAPTDRPVVMLNLLRFRDAAEYGEGSEHPPATGRSAYFDRYVPAFRALAPIFGGAEPVYLGTAHELLVGTDDERWDTVALLRYPDLQTLKTFLTDERYLHDAAPHRVAALADWRFLVTTSL